MSGSGRSTGSPYAVRRLVPLALAGAMIALIGVSFLVSTAPGASAVPAPAQYTTPPSNNTGIFSNASVLAGIGAILVIAILVVLALILMRRKGPGGSADEEKEETSDDTGDEDTGDENADVSPMGEEPAEDS